MSVISMQHVRNKYRHIPNASKNRQYLTYTAYKRVSNRQFESLLKLLRENRADEGV